VLVLRTYPSLQVFAAATARLSADPEYQKAGVEYLSSPKSNPAFERIDSWLMLAFAGMPKLEWPAYCWEKKPRMFELRTYESYSEAMALKKVEMFNSVDSARATSAPSSGGRSSEQPAASHPHARRRARSADERRRPPDVGQDEERSAIRRYGVSIQSVLRRGMLQI
jgi:hypothetical protein